LANLVGRIQELAWSAVEKLLPPPGQAPDPVAVDMLSGKATKTPPDLLGTPADTVSNSITAQAATLDLPQLSHSPAELSRSQGADDLAALVGEGLSTAGFFASGAHTDYHALVDDTATCDIGRWRWQSWQ
jgi:hypothetical protein